MTSTTGRRNFLKIAATIGGGLVLGFDWFSANAEIAVNALSKAELAEGTSLNSYLYIAQDNTITIFSPNPEVGQNIKTSFPTIIAEELDADWTKVKVVQAPFDNSRFERQVTGGSGATPHSYKKLRRVGATARQMLLEAASKQWNVPVAECSTENGFVIHSSGKRSSYGELSIEASKLSVPQDVKLKDRKDFKLIGKRVKNVENKNIATGKALYGMDFYREGMLYAMVQRPEGFGMKLKAVESAAAKAMPGIIDVITFKNNVAIIGKSTWQLLKARKALKVTYENTEKLESTDDHNRIFSELMAKPEATVRRKNGDPDAAFASAAKIIKSEYQCPFLPHNPMEPMNFFADVKTDSVELVGPTQNPGSARSSVSKLLGIPENKISLEITRIGGGFGRRLMDDFVLEAAELSSILKAPVKVVWSREDDMMGGYYRPAVRYRFEAALDAKNDLIGYRLRGAGINAGNPTRENNFPSGAVENLLIESIEHKSPISTAPWRAPITNFLAFAEQSFLDEVALATGKDPVQFRLDLLNKAKTAPVGPVRYDVDRMIGVIKLAAEKSGWGTKKEVSQGFSVYFSHASYVAIVAEASIKNNKPQISKIYAATDCGEVVSPMGARQQVIGGIVDGFGHAMYGKLSFKNGTPEQNNYHKYRLIRMREIPEVEAHFVDNGLDPTGLGEPSLPPTSGAVANAIYKATGKRIRNQPFIDEAPFKVKATV
ncbi:xanthine dehydrogenase family protein molybdopterin-binding subunit [Desertivirga brevis]|uniref:xanthine dehydrogenase family protein molybdopterin-binding subunit n=1 Tax=Desertivirga brevis TaxID=2810310 RepID=UPI001A97A923|nr:molybdopterin cofactor-binding domain-containing protein [Pedobacter sp. SYSU D00873]